MKRIIIGLIFCFNVVFAQDVVVNEVMTLNSTTILDEYNEASDWIEIYNNKNSDQNLSGYFLSDDSLDLQKWMFSEINIKANEKLIVYASGRDTVIEHIHTNFKLSSSGETLFFSNSSGDIIDKIYIPASLKDVSYGRKRDGNELWVFQEPTPGAANTGVEIKGVANEISVSHLGGFYSSAVSIELSAGDSEIYYTLDGSDPDTRSTKYSSPITLKETAVLKAFSRKDNYLDGPIIYQTYIFNENTHLPVISISTDPDNLFSSDSGIYVNYKQDWERPAHIEFFDNNELGFSENVGVNIYGGYTRRFSQKSLAVKFKNKYGKKELKYDLFPGFRIKKFKSFILRNSGNDFEQTHIRDAFQQTLIKDLDIDYLEYRPAVTYINGEYWGIYNIREKISEHYVANRHGVDPNNIDMMEGYSAYNDDVNDPDREFGKWVGNLNPIHGDTIHYKELIDYLYTQDLTSNEAFEFIDNMIDLDECLLYYASHVYFNSQDWPANNSKYWRERTPEGKWRWIIYDLDFGFNLYEYHNEGNKEDHVDYLFSGDPSQRPWSKPVESTFIPRKIVENEIIKNRFVNQVADLLNTNFQPERVLKILNEINDGISNDIDRHRKRWGLSGSGFDRMISFANERSKNVRDHVRNFFNAGDNCAINITATPGGDVKLNTLKLTESDLPFSGVYFDQTPITLSAIPLEGFKFDGWSGDITSSEKSITRTFSRSNDVQANFSVDPNYSKTIVINEINYNSSPDFDTEDWIEFHNVSNTSIDISGWHFTDNDPAHKFLFPAGTVINAKDYLVLTKNDSLFISLFPGVTNYVGVMDFGLSASGESIKLIDTDGIVVDSILYDDILPWPLDADGLGSTLELIDPNKDNSLAVNWKSSIGHGTPGKINSVVTNVAEGEKELFPTKFNLSQNYPNPFNPSTNINYSIPSDSKVAIKVFDVLGRLVQTLVDKELSAGNYNVQFNAKNLSNGIYFYRIEANNFVETKKMVLIK